jgi:hypothetical protein
MFPSKYLQPVCDLIWGNIQNLVFLRFSRKNLLESGQVSLVARDKLSAGVCGGIGAISIGKTLNQIEPGLLIKDALVEELLLEMVELRPEQVRGWFPGGDLMTSREAQGLGGLDCAEQGSEIW